MIDIDLLRENPEVLKASQEARGESAQLVDEAIAADQARRAAMSTSEHLRARQKVLGKAISSDDGESRAALVEQAQELANEVKEAQRVTAEADAAFEGIARSIPNLIVRGVPAGGEDDFVTLRTVGSKPQFTFTPKDHEELGEHLGIIDVRRGAKVSGSRFYYLRGLGARLEIALMNFGLDRAIEYGFEPLVTPTLVRPEMMDGTGYLGGHATEVYHLPKDDLYLTGTSEVALAGYHAGEVLPISDDAARVNGESTIRYAGWSTCFRREAGSAGKDNRGILRVHQFNKLEMFSYVHPDEAETEHAALVSYQEKMMQDLGLHYRVIDVAAGDLGASAARKYDIEAWVPTQGKFRELTSTSNCLTFQARRLGIRYRMRDGALAHVATLNGTLATTRWLVAILECYQQDNGSVVVPEILQPYMGGISVIDRH